MGQGARGAGPRDFIRAHLRLLYLLAHGDAHEAAALPSAVARTGEYFGAYIDDKPASKPRITKFILSTEEPRQDIPPEQGRRAARRGARPRANSGRSVSLREEDAAP